MSATAGQAADGVRSLADRFGIEPGMVVMEMGYDDDVDEDLRDTLIDRCGELVDEDTDEVVDVVLLWWRDGDGDLVDTLVDALGPLADNGVVWLLTIPMMLTFAALGASSHWGGWYGALGGAPAWVTAVPPVDAETARAFRNTALVTVVAMLLGLVGSVLGGWLASGEPMSVTYYRRRTQDSIERPRRVA